MLEQKAVDSVKSKEIRYLDVLRCFATLGVVMLHVCMTEPSNYTIDMLGRVNSVFYYVGYLLTRWTVPAFLMITGSLLLQDSYVDTTQKYIRRIVRMSIVLVLFGTGYAAMEMVFTEGLSNWYWTLPKLLLRVLQMQSWDHLWYLYLLLGIYILLPVLKAGLNQCSEKFILGLLVALYVLDFAVPTINAIAGLSITNLYIAISSNYFYLICGYYLTVVGNRLEKPKYRYLIYSVTVGSLVTCGGGRYLHLADRKKYRLDT